MSRIRGHDNDTSFNALAFERKISSRRFELDYNESGHGMNHVNCFSRHSHSAIEVICVISGAMHIECSGESFTASAGELTVFNPFEMHYAYIDRELPHVDYVYATIELSTLQGAVIAANRAPVADLISQKSIISPRIQSGELARELCGRLLECSEHYAASKERASASYLLLGTAANVVGQLIESGMLTKPTASVLSARRFTQRMNRFIEENYMNEIEIGELLEELSWTQVHFCRVFKGSYGTTFSRYLREYRLQKALERMVDDDSETPKLAQIAEQVGFTDYSYFSRAFKEYHGISPSEYHERWLSMASRKG